MRLRLFSFALLVLLLTSLAGCIPVPSPGPQTPDDTLRESGSR